MTSARRGRRATSENVLSDVAAIDLLETSPRELLAWLDASGLAAGDVLAFAARGVRDSSKVSEFRAYRELLDALPAGAQVSDDELAAFVRVGPAVWIADQESVDEWAAVGRLADDLNERLSGQRSIRRVDANGERRDAYPGWRAVCDLFEAGRSPSFGMSMLRMAGRHDNEVDAYGFGDGVSASVYDDLASAGIRCRAELAGYELAGMSLTDAVGYAVDGIAPPAVLMAHRERVPREQWRDLLTGLPAQWFRPLVENSFGADAGNPAKWDYFTSAPTPVGDSDIFTLADLRFLADHGWGEKQQLYPYDMKATFSCDPAVARRLAEHQMTWSDMSRWGDALTVGKAPRTRSDATVAPLAYRLKPELVDGVVAMHDVGLRPSHLGEYRKGGCRSVQDVLRAKSEGITPARVKELLAEHGRQPSKWHNTKVFDTFGQLLRVHRGYDAQD